MDHKEKISKVSKDINYLKKMDINSKIKDMLTQELQAKKNAKNKQLTQLVIRKKKLH